MRDEILAALAGFVKRVAAGGGSPAEVEALPGIADLLLCYSPLD